MDRIGTSGTSGTRNDRGRSGCFLRSTITLAATMMKANSVPMLVNSANVSMSQRPAGIPTRNPAIQVPIYGVRNVLCTAPKTCRAADGRATSRTRCAPGRIVPPAATTPSR